MQEPSLDDRIEQLSAIEAFPPPGFVEHAQACDPSNYIRAAADGPTWWAGQARERPGWQTPAREKENTP